MKNILLLLSASALIACAASCRHGKAAEEIKADSIRIADSIKAARPAALKNAALDGLTRYLKKQVSSDPDVGEVLQTEDVIVSDTLYFAKAKTLVSNRFGAKEQYGDLWFCVCEKSSRYYMIVWASSDRCDSGLNHIIGTGCFILGGEFKAKITDSFREKLYKGVTNGETWDMESLINDF